MSVSTHLTRRVVLILIDLDLDLDQPRIHPVITDSIRIEFHTTSVSLAHHCFEHIVRLRIVYLCTQTEFTHSLLQGQDSQVRMECKMIARI
jgi:hypothetical protein